MTETLENTSEAVVLELTSQQIRQLESLNCPKGTREKCVKTGPNTVSCTCMPDTGEIV